MIKKIAYVMNRTCVIITDFDECTNKFLKNYYRYVLHEADNDIINDILTKEDFFLPYINVLTKKNEFKILYDVLQLHGIKPTIEIMQSIYYNKNCKIFSDIHADFMVQIENLKLISIDKLGKKEFDLVANKDKARSYIYISTNLIE